MVGARRLLTVTLAWLLMPTKTPGVDGSGQSSIVGADLNVTREPSDSPGSANASGIIDARDSEQYENGTTLGCPCDLNQCERFCCPRGYSYALDAKYCVEDTLSPQIRGFEKSIENYHVMSDMIHRWNAHYRYGCWHTPIPHTRNGLICLINVSEYFDFEDYCVYRELNKSNYAILQCIQLPDPNEMEKVDYRGNEESNGYRFALSWILVCVGSASLVALATFIVYSLVPELKNFQGWIVRSYLASYFSSMIAMTSICFLFGFLNTTSLVPTLLLAYFGFACLLWLNVMSFDIWRTFRKLRSSCRAVNDKDRQRTTFIRYSMYAWGIPVLPISSAAIAWASNQLSLAGGMLFLELLTLLPLSGIFVCNTYFFISTALTIRKCNKETAQMVDDASKHHQKNKQWFNLYLKLFLIMGCPIVLWAVAMTVRSNTFSMVVLTLELLQALCVFYMLVWKDDVKRSIRQQFAGMLRRLGWYRQRVSTSEIQDGI